MQKSHQWIGITLRLCRLTLTAQVQQELFKLMNGQGGNTAVLAIEFDDSTIWSVNCPNAECPIAVCRQSEVSKVIESPWFFRSGVVKAAGVVSAHVGCDL